MTCRVQLSSVYFGKNVNANEHNQVLTVTRIIAHNFKLLILFGRKRKRIYNVSLTDAIRIFNETRNFDKSITWEE